MNNIVTINNINIANHLPLVLIAGPCQIESLKHAMMMAEALLEITRELNIPFIYKSSFDKANRSSINGKRGIGLNEGLAILAKVKAEFNCPILTDVHNENQCASAAKVADILQIPAFLCRQTDLLAAAAATGKIVNVKKGQFLAPSDMHNVYEKLIHMKAQGIMLTERGTSFGYNNLVSDMRSLSIMAKTKAPVIFDATHSVQQPGGFGDKSGGERQYVELLSRCALAAGVAGLFLEVHNDPDKAPSDGPCMLKLDNLKNILLKLVKYDQITKELCV